MKTTKYFIIGSGLVGQHFHEFLKGSILSKKIFTDPQEIEREIEKYRPDVLINAAGITGRPNIDWCDEHKLETLQGNTILPMIILQACEKLNQYWVHIGTGSVYQGDNGGKGWTEEDRPNIDRDKFYYQSKIWSEDILKNFQVLQLRLVMPIDDIPSKRNYFAKLTRYKDIVSISNSMSAMDDFLKASEQLMEKRETGIYNVVNKGTISNEEVLSMYKDIVDPNHTYNLIQNDTIKRSNCVLSIEKLEKEGIEMRDVKTAVGETLIRYAKNLQN